MVHPAIWDAIDRVVTTEYRTPEINLGMLAPLYAAARERAGAALSQAAAERLAAVLKPGRPVVLTTGAGGPPWFFRGETDGPLGLACLARAMSLGYGVWPLVVTEERNVPPVTATLVAAGVSVLDEELARTRPTTAAFAPFATDPAAARVEAVALIDRYRPSAVIAIEKTSPNRKGIIHSVTGKTWPGVDYVRVEHLLEVARERGILTIGIGDHGNEMGLGLIEDAIRATVPRADVCQCPCGAGMASGTVADIAMPVSISNWGAYAIEAGLAILRGRPELMHDAEAERTMLRACVDAGGVDGATSRQILGVDGTSADVQAAIVTLLAALVGKALTSQGVDY